MKNATITPDFRNMSTEEIFAAYVRLMAGKSAWFPLNLTKKTIREEAKTKTHEEMVNHLMANVTQHMDLGEPTASSAKKVKKEKVAKVEVTEKAEKAPVETVGIKSLELGDVIRYKSSKKPYIISERREDSHLLFSTTQVFEAKKDFEVVLIKKGDGKLPVSFGDVELDNLLALALEDLEKRKSVEKLAPEVVAEKPAKAKKVKAVVEESIVDVTNEKPQPIRWEAPEQEDQEYFAQ